MNGGQGTRKLEALVHGLGNSDRQHREDFVRLEAKVDKLMSRVGVLEKLLVEERRKNDVLSEEVASLKGKPKRDSAVRAKIDLETRDKRKISKGDLGTVKTPPNAEGVTEVVINGILFDATSDMIEFV